MRKGRSFAIVHFVLCFFCCRPYFWLIMENDLKRMSLAVLSVLVSLCFAVPESLAQGKIEVASFRRLETDISARVTAPRTDQNGEVCALIRVVTSEPDLMFEPDALGIVARENHPGEVWLYVPRGARRVSLMHSRLGVLRNYFYPDIIEQATVYEMVVRTGDEARLAPVDTNTQLLVLRPDPETADVYIDGEKMPLVNGLFTATMKKGEYAYRVEAPMYATQAGVVALGDEQVVKSIRLQPLFGYLEVFSLPEQDAAVCLDGDTVGHTPYKSDRLPLGTFDLNLSKDTYYPVDTTVIIRAGQTTALTVNMLSALRPAEPRNILVMAQAGWHPSQLSLGGMVGFVRRNGYYAGFRSSFTGTEADGLECDDSGALSTGERPYYSGQSHTSRLSVTVGYLRRLWHPLYIYVGAGYGSRTLAWETIDGRQVKNTDHSATGVAAEAGVIGRVGMLGISVGFHTVNFKHNEASVGIGVFF